MDHPLPIIGASVANPVGDDPLTANESSSAVVDVRGEPRNAAAALATTRLPATPEGPPSVGPVAAGSEKDAAGIISDRWPTLSAAMSRYHRATAEKFSGAAYAQVTAGLIRLDDRRRLAALAENLGIRPFDAQLLIACAIRQWALDHRADTRPNPEAPHLSFEYRSWRHAWVRFGLIATLAFMLDYFILVRWLS